ncbi:hypothetical protein QA596_11220 [Balneolales bacterium ANBcel1]|nr:hypothetical protein [Balneolales bacterium ANBcel1]
MDLLRKWVFFWMAAAGVLASANLQAQVALEKERVVAVTVADSLVVLDPWILPETFDVLADGEPLAEEQWSLDPVRGVWSWDAPQSVRASADTLRFSYRVWPLDLPVSVYEREWVDTDTLRDADDPEEFEQIARRAVTRQDLFAGTDLNRSGSIRRGVVVGSAQDFSLESGLNFDISGNITDDLELVASLTDRSTPIQPDGTTQTLREFDQVYIRLSHEMGRLQMGDIDMRLDRSNFAVIDRRLQGVDVRANLNRYGDYQGSAAVVRGQYHEMAFRGEDGVQGPYRLAGAENEAFIIVLAGSERVYINGQRMVRGEENDYVIDYGLGEITFTSNRIITDHSRITVDFQYLTDAYTRTVISAEAEHDRLLNGRASFGASIIREADNVNMSSRLFLTDTEREVLRQAGDDPSRAVVSGADSVGFRRDADFLLYSRVDTLFEGEQYRIFEHIPGDSSGVFRVQFSRVGEGEGDYRRVGRAANGILYEWVGPGKGNYAPQRQISRPVEQSMIALRSSFRATSHLTVYGEWAGSYHDRNRLSPLDNHNNHDMGFLGGVELTSRPTRLGRFGLDVRGRYEGEHFAYFDRVREVEFDRRWNLSELQAASERRLEGSGRWAPSDFTELEIGAGAIERGEFDGTRGDMRLLSEEEGLPGIDYYLEYVASSDRYRDQEGNWLRQRGRIDHTWSAPGGTLHPEFVFEQEDRRQRATVSDSLLPQSFRFFEIGPGLFYRITDEFRIGSTLRYREDRGILNGEMRQESHEMTQRYVLEYGRGSQFRTENMLGLRKRVFDEAFRQEQQRMDSRGVLVRSVTDYRPWNRFVETQLLYDANTERRPLMQEAFIEVGPEMGQYVWEDLNNDGVQQVDEFFPEQSPNEGTFIKQLIPSEELFPVIALRVRWRTSLDPSRLIDPHDARFSDWLDFLSGIRWNSVVDIREENRTEDLEDIYLLRLDRFRDDSLTISGRVFLEQDLELFRNNTRRDLRFTADRMLSQNRQASGIEKQRIENLTARGGGRLGRRYRVSAAITVGKSENLSETFASRNYSIISREIRPRVDIRWNQSVNSGAGVSLIRKRDSHPAETAQVTGVTTHLDSRLNLAARWQATVRVEYRRFDLSGGPSTTMGEFEMTEGAGLGSTWSWSVQSDYRISDFLRASLQYDGRTVTARPLVQTMRFTMSAVF